MTFNDRAAVIASGLLAGITKGETASISQWLLDAYIHEADHMTETYEERIAAVSQVAIDVANRIARGA